MLEANISAIRDDLKTLMKDAQQLLAEAAKLSGSKSEDMQAKAMELLDIAIENAQHLQQVGTEKGKHIAKETDSYVHDHPWQAIGVTAAACLLIGMFLGRR